MKKIVILCFIVLFGCGSQQTNNQELRTYKRRIIVTEPTKADLQTIWKNFYDINKDYEVIITNWDYTKTYYRGKPKTIFPKKFKAMGIKTVHAIVWKGEKTPEYYILTWW